MQRRQFLAGAVGVGFSCVLRAAERSKVRLGGPLFLKTTDPGELAREHRRLGYSAAYCPSFLKTGDEAAIAATRKAFDEQNVVLAEVGAWVNLLDADPDKRRQNLQYVTDRLALAEALGARCCVDIAGSFNPKLWDGPDPRNLTKEFLDATVENCRKLIDGVKPTRTKFSIEMMAWSLPNNADSYVQLIRAVDRPAFGAHIDICNLIDCSQKYYANAAVTTEVFRKLGRWILSCHAKDIGPRSGHFVETIPGRGGIDYIAYLTRLSELPQETPLMLEHLSSPEDYDEARAYVQRVAAAAGVALG